MQQPCKAKKFKDSCLHSCVRELLYSRPRYRPGCMIHAFAFSLHSSSKNISGADCDPRTNSLQNGPRLRGSFQAARTMRLKITGTALRARKCARKSVSSFPELQVLFDLCDSVCWRCAIPCLRLTLQLPPCLLHLSPSHQVCFSSCEASYLNCTTHQTRTNL